MRSWIDHAGEIVRDPSPSVITQLVAAAQPFWLAGFWGQNFNVLTGSIEKGWPAFLVLGVGLSTACVVVAVVLLSRRRWN